ncbi:tryptophan--tRNA ligase [Bacillus sp. JCM 19041]|uniref:tryptophan--tRNA ligase n=1 Tax=Bacillus sp. JCM 19041 TaxID=1460637 RepID=UPI0006D13650
MQKRSLTGVKPTGNIHLGNYIGAIKPALKLAENHEAFYFIANAHGLTKVHDGTEMQQLTEGIAAAWLALGVDPEKSVLYRQSDIPEVFELSWILATFASKGLMNRAHAYKAIVDENNRLGKETDEGVNMGLFTYPILMASDILLFKPDIVPVGKDQIQHIEIARDLAGIINRNYGETFLLPNVHIDDVAVLPGLDGRKMSKSYSNIIPLFTERNKLKKLVNTIKTNSLPPNAPKDPDESTVFLLYKEFASSAEEEAMRRSYEEGISWGEAKHELFTVVDRFLEEPRERYEELTANPDKLDKILQEGAEKARAFSVPFLHEIKQKIGLSIN